MATSQPTRRCRSLPEGRTLHLLDLENLAGTDRPSAAALRAAAAAYRSTVRVAPGDHVVISSDINVSCDAGLAWPGARLVPGTGPDGADRALLAATDARFAAARYDRVVIGSGDHAFTDLVIDLRANRVAVCVVSRPVSLSRGLGRAAGLALPLAVVAASDGVVAA